MTYNFVLNIETEFSTSDMTFQIVSHWNIQLHENPSFYFTSPQSLTKTINIDLIRLDYYISTFLPIYISTHLHFYISTFLFLPCNNLAKLETLKNTILRMSVLYWNLLGKWCDAVTVCRLPRVASNAQFFSNYHFRCFSVSISLTVNCCGTIVSHPTVGSLSVFRSVRCGRCIDRTLILTRNS